MKYAFVNGIILDGTKDMEAKEGLAILVDEGKITAIQSHVPSGYVHIDLKGKFILPGLINLHVHLPATGKPKKKETDTKKLVKFATSNNLTRKYLESIYHNSVKTQLMSGVTTLRTMGGVEDYDAKTRDLILQGKIIGPRILSSNMAISVPGGHMAGSLAYEATSQIEARNYVDEIAKGNPDVIKLMITGGVLDATKLGEPGILKMAPELVKAACDRAHELGFQVAAHVESPEGVSVALENGVDTIEHGAKPDETIIKLFKERKASHVATLSPALPYALFDREVSHVSEMAQYNGKVVFDGIIECAKICLENDIPVGLGTDTGCPYITHYDMWREVNYFQKYCGVSNRFALYTATLQNAKIAKIDHETGSIEVGKSADFMVVKENPLESLEALRHVEMVVFKGTIHKDISIKKMKNVEQALDMYK